jgi:protocatechuate 3,4-dioxygenase beta subunit
MLTRREFVAKSGLVASGILLGCGAQEKKPLAVTEANIEGPYYRADAPLRSKLAEGLKGEALKITGKVLNPDGTPLAEALVDVWQADKEGVYDNTSDKFVLRGRLRTDKNGLYVYETIMPGQYDLGESKRPAHIHYKVSAKDHKPLTTQLYFSGDKYLDRDPFVRRSLIIAAEKGAGTFDIVLAKS